VRGATRGNGSASARTLRRTSGRSGRAAAPARQRNRRPLLEIRGEVYMPLSGFREMNERRGGCGRADLREPAQRRCRRAAPARCAPHGAAAASLLRLPDPVRSRLAVQCYRSPRRRTCSTLLDAWGVPVNPQPPFVPRASTDVMRSTSTRSTLSAHDLDYGIDGVVVKVAPLWLWPELGVIGEREPRYAIAYKYPPDLAYTRLLDIELNVGRTGSLNPYARARAGRDRWRHGEAGHAPQFRGHRAQGPARRRHGRRQARRRGHPAGGRSGRRAADWRGASVAPPATAVLRAAPRSSGPPGEVMMYCPNSSCQRVYTGASSTSCRSPRWTSADSASERRRNCSSAELVRDLRGPVCADRGRPAALEGFGGIGTPTSCESIAQSRTRPLSRVLFALGVRHVGTARCAGARTRVRHHRSDHGGHDEELGRCTASATPRPPRWSHSWPSRATAR
jgi:DNA ligase (NAD+)